MTRTAPRKNTLWTTADNTVRRLDKLSRLRHLMRTPAKPLEKHATSTAATPTNWEPAEGASSSGAAVGSEGHCGHEREGKHLDCNKFLTLEVHF
ncbi:hypothetical protein EYF80_035966 [Liparis tanakae]|uniref:Uncharacterized protein n=1 Tax=Liparis tanakae TaxID=230148 RepID=A0A4Z2GKT3_9TELE|nr:hypothetical protein EYF80_035966 [Liparis tanakae]